MRGVFTFFAGTLNAIRVPNIIVDEGELAFLKMIAQDDQTVVAGAGDYFMGLCEEIPDETHTLASITTEPTAAGGYARQPISRDATGFPTVTQINDAHRALSLQVSFAAAGADFSRSIQRAFLCNVVSGTAGILFAYSGLLPNPITILDGVTFPATYELYLR